MTSAQLERHVEGCSQTACRRLSSLVMISPGYPYAEEIRLKAAVFIAKGAISSYNKSIARRSQSEVSILSKRWCPFDTAKAEVLSEI